VAWISYQTVILLIFKFSFHYAGSKSQVLQLKDTAKPHSPSFCMGFLPLEQPRNTHNYYS